MSFFSLFFPILDRAADGALQESDYAPIERARAIPAAHRVTRAEISADLAHFGGQPSDLGNGDPTGCGLGQPGDPDDIKEFIR